MWVKSNLREHVQQPYTGSIDKLRFPSKAVADSEVCGISSVPSKSVTVQVFVVFGNDSDPDRFNENEFETQKDIVLLHGISCILALGAQLHTSPVKPFTTIPFSNW